MMISAAALGIVLIGAVTIERPGVTLVAERVSDCSDVVDRVLLKTKGRLLSVRPHDDRCTVTVLVQHDGDRPEKIVIRGQYADDDLDQSKE